MIAEDEQKLEVKWLYIMQSGQAMQQSWMENK